MTTFPLGDCRDPDVATRCAAAMVAGSAMMSASTDAEFWQAKITTCLAAMLHAAALTPGATLVTVRDWAVSCRAEAAEAVLANHGQAAWSRSVAEICERSGERSARTVAFGVADVTARQIREV